MNLVIVGIILLMFMKWIIFILLLPFIKIWYKTKSKIENKKQNNLLSSLDGSNKESFLKKIRLNLFRFIAGYLRYMDFQIGLIPSHFLRNFVYKNIYGVQIGKHSIIYWGAEIRSPHKLLIGRGSIIGDKSILDARNGIKIGRNVNFSSSVHIYTEHHDHRDPLFKSNSNNTFRVKIDDRVWVGPNVTILHSVHLGEGAVVAAGAVVTKDVESYSIVAGIPAKKIGERNKNLIYEFNGDNLPFY